MLIKFIANTIYSDVKSILYKLIVETKENKELSSITAAKNAITILVAAKESFSGKDLRNINIKGANIRDMYIP